MKLKSLHIDSYRHLENLHFDFTYPDGHEKAGKPLEKICIIGQSATGKTSLLELIKDECIYLNDLHLIEGKFIFRHSRFFDLKNCIEFSLIDGTLKIAENKIVKNGNIYNYIKESGGGSSVNLLEDELKLIYLSSEIISTDLVNVFNKNPIDITSSITNFNEIFNFRNFEQKNYTIEFLEKFDDKIWYFLLLNILQYRKKFTQMASELINKGAIGDLSKLNKHYANWTEENENPLISFSQKFNPILSKLNLEIDLVNTEYTIPIKSKLHDEVIPISSLSTGTKSLLLSMFPIYELDTKDAIILLDEPERSLFPDMQVDLMSHYQNLAPDAQFIVATHSPFIAAAFEPEERFILYFDEKGKVQVRRGESPIGDDPNDILHNDFNVDYYNEFGKKAYKEYRDLKTKAISEKDAKKKNELILEITKIGDKYNF
jgi:AAA domain, putative AbiEii toxin, Type IV TA system